MGVYIGYFPSIYGLQALLPLYQHGLMHGSAEVREQSASALGKVAFHTCDCCRVCFFFHAQPILIPILRRSN